MESDVPRYLQAEGVVKLSVKEVNGFINGFWHHRLNSAQDPPFPVGFVAQIHVAFTYLAISVLH